MLSITRCLRPFLQGMLTSLGVHAPADAALLLPHALHPYRPEPTQISPPPGSSASPSTSACDAAAAAAHPCFQGSVQQASHASALPCAWRLHVELHLICCGLGCLQQLPGPCMRVSSLRAFAVAAAAAVHALIAAKIASDGDHQSLMRPVTWWTVKSFAGCASTALMSNVSHITCHICCKNRRWSCVARCRYMP